MTEGKGSFHFSGTIIITVENKAQKTLADDFAALFTHSAGFTPRVTIGGKQAAVRFVTDKSQSGEAYQLHISPRQITLKSASLSGFFYALQTVRQLLPSDIERSQRTATKQWTVPCVDISDSPRFAYRGLMLDVARLFQPKASFIRIIDCMAMLKMNELHLHLVDDNGWRLQIKKYPRLTSVGAWRVDRGTTPFPARHNATPDEHATIGGFYTQQDMKEIIDYAARRRVEVIPEIEMPAHSNAALAAYPQLACPVVKKFIGVLPGLGGKNADIIYCAGNDSTFTFLQNVLDEVLALFPSRYIHLGGDEAWKTNWKVCPLCQKRIKDEHLADEEALQGYFMERMASYVRSKGRTVLGWDELTNTTIPRDAVIMGWQGTGQAALKAAALGHRFIMTPARMLYLIRYQGPQWFEPLTYFGNNTLKDIYDYEPVQQDWKPEYASLLLGVQASMWTEFCNKPSDVDYMVFPRLAALAETAWTPVAQKDWKHFLCGLDNYDRHLAGKGLVYARSMYNIQHIITPENGKLRVELECIRPDMEIRYTLDGTTPTAKSTLYSAPILVGNALTLRCATFNSNQQMGKTLELPIHWNLATGKSVISDNPTTYVLTNGIRGSLKYTDFEWCCWEKSDSASFVIDLQQPQRMKRLSIGCFTNYGMAVHNPKLIRISVSDDNKSYAVVAEQTLSAEQIFREGTFIDDYQFDMHAAKARYVKVTAYGAGLCPDNHVRPGQEARFYFDEVRIE
jgi:hexosaminidase